MPATLMLGPLAFPTDRLLALAALLLFLALSGQIAARWRRPDAGDAGWAALLVGLVVARIGWILANLSAYRADPWSMIAFWQGGFAFWPGVVAAGLFIAYRLGRTHITGAMLAALGGVALIYASAAALLAPRPVPLPHGLVLRHLDGRALSLDSLRGRPFVVNLWASWCPPCRREMPTVAQVAAEQSASSTPVPVLLANQGENAETVRAYLARGKLPARGVLLDADALIGQATGSAALPTTLFVDAKGQIRQIHSGEISRAALMQGIAALRALP